MSVDTEIQGTPSSIESAAAWLRTSPAAKLEAAADTCHAVRATTQRSWEGVAGDEFAGIMATASGATDVLERATREMARDLEGFASSLRRCQGDMADVRGTATAAGPTVSGFLVQHPGAGPIRPPDDVTGTPTEVAAHNDRVAAYNAHQDLGSFLAGAAAGAIDSLFENGPDVGAALEEGWEAIEDTGGAIADGVSGAIGAVGGWLS